MTDLLDGKLSAHDFLRLQEQAWFFYSALEEAAHCVSHGERAGLIVDEALDRTAALESDIAYLHRQFYGEGAAEEGTRQWRANVTPIPATVEYVERLQRIRDERDEIRLIAHHYVRCLGDLSGGQVIATMMRRNYGIAPEALQFYRFEGIAKLKPYKDNYRKNLDAMRLNPAERQTLLEEATEAFVLNMNVFAGLERGEK